MTQENAMTREELLQTLRALAVDVDTELSHIEADEALLAFINDPEIAAAFGAIHKWYA